MVVLVGVNPVGTAVDTIAIVTVVNLRSDSGGSVATTSGIVEERELK